MPIPTWTPASSRARLTSTSKGVSGRRRDLSARLPMLDNVPYIYVGVLLENVVAVCLAAVSLRALAPPAQPREAAAVQAAWEIGPLLALRRCARLLLWTTLLKFRLAEKTRGRYPMLPGPRRQALKQDLGHRLLTCCNVLTVRHRRPRLGGPRKARRYARSLIPLGVSCSRLEPVPAAHTQTPREGPPLDARRGPSTSGAGRRCAVGAAWGPWRM